MASSIPAERAATARLRSLKLDDPFMAFWGALNREIIQYGLHLSFESATDIWNHTIAIAQLEADKIDSAPAATGSAHYDLIAALRDAARHTPGPWETNGTAIETVAMPAAVIGRAYDEREDCGIESYSEAAANARLIAAAPELYEALRRLLDEQFAPAPGTLKLAAAALAKAEGRQP